MKNIILILIILFATNLNAQLVGDATIEIQTSEGSITLQLDGRRAPITVENFINLIKVNILITLYFIVSFQTL